MYPLSFKEYLKFNNYDTSNIEEKFYEYLKYGGLPAITQIKDKNNLVMTYLNDIYNAIVKKDIIERNSIKDIALLENIVKYVSSNIGSSILANKISDYLNSNRVDFIAENPNEIKYYQVTQSLKEASVLERELRSLESIHDNYEKIILTIDRTINNDYNGIKVINIIDFLLNDK